MADELKRIFPAEIYTTQTGEDVSVSPVPFGKLVTFGDTLAGIVTKMTLAGIDLEKFSMEDVGRVFTIAFDEIIVLMGLVLDRPRDWFDTITITDGIGLLTKIIEQNFNEETKKKLEALHAKVPSIST